MDGITDSVGMSWSPLQEIAEDRGAWCAAAHGVMEAHRIERLDNDQAL